LVLKALLTAALCNCDQWVGVAEVLKSSNLWGSVESITGTTCILHPQHCKGVSFSLTNRCTCMFCFPMADLVKISASPFAPAFHATPLRLPPFGPSGSNFDDDDSGAETEHDEWLDESQFPRIVPGNISEATLVEVRLFLFSFLLFFFTSPYFRRGRCGRIRLWLLRPT